MGPILTLVALNIAHETAPPPLYPILTTMTSAIALLNPITTMFFVRSYREALLRAVKCGRKRVQPVDVTITKPSEMTLNTSHQPSDAAVDIAGVAQHETGPIRE